MKKIISMILLLATLLCISSCGKGTSIAIQAVRLDNQVENLFIWDTKIKSLTEKNVYKDKDGNDVFVSEYYYEDADDIYSMYNICETIGNYKLYAYEGAVYTETEKGITAVILFSCTYTDFISSYLQDSFPLDGEVLNQKNSQKDGENIIAYYIDENLAEKFASIFEVPSEDEIDVTYRGNTND